jgi:hypothetical protein
MFSKKCFNKAVFIIAILVVLQPKAQSSTCQPFFDFSKKSSFLNQRLDQGGNLEIFQTVDKETQREADHLIDTYTSQINEDKGKAHYSTILFGGAKKTFSIINDSIPLDIKKVLMDHLEQLKQR